MPFPRPMDGRRLATVLSAACWLSAAACSGSDDDHSASRRDAAVDAAPDGEITLADAAPDGEVTLADAGLDGAPAADAAVDPDVAHVVIGETVGALEVPFTFDASGSGTDRIGLVEVDEGAAWIVIDGEEIGGIVYEHQPWDGFDYDTFQVLLVAPDHWVVLWIYCQGADLTDLYFESSDGTPLAYEPATGVCTLNDVPSTVEVALPAVDMHVDTLVDGYRVAGADLQIEGAAPGALYLDSTELTVLVFRDVDCTTECGPPGWYELHAVLWERAAGRAGFGIFYLLPDDAPVLLTYVLMLPDLTDPAGETEIVAAWERLAN